MDRLTILHHDDDLLAVSKPPGFTVHRDKFSKRDEQFILQIASHQTGRFLYPVQRLDRNTSGVMCFALSSATAKTLQANLGAEDAWKEYLTLVRGETPETFVSTRPLKSPSGEPLPSRSEFRRLAFFSRSSLLAVRITTGRHHQIRRHLSHLAHQIIGDSSHGKGRINAWFRENYGLPRMFLHAYRLAFAHPGTSERIDLRDPLAEDLSAFLSRLPDVPAGVLAELSS